MKNKNIFVFDIEYSGKGTKVKITPNNELVKIAKIMQSKYKKILLKDIITYINLDKESLAKNGISEDYILKFKNRNKVGLFRNVNGIENIELVLTSEPYFKYAGNPVYYIDFAYSILNLTLYDDNNKIHSVKNTPIVYSEDNMDSIPKITKMCQEIGNATDNIITSYNVGADYGRILISLACHRFFSNKDTGGTGTASAISTLLQLKKENKIFDVRHVFIKLFKAQKNNKDKLEMMYVRWCIENGYITRALNIETKMETVIRYYRNNELSKNKENKSLINSSEIKYNQSHSAKGDVEDLINLIKMKISYHKLDWSIYFDALSEDNFKSDFLSIQVKNLFDKKDYKKELANNGYIVYGSEKKPFSELSETDIDNIIDIPFNVKIRKYIDSTTAVSDFIEKINSMSFKNNKERMDYLKNTLKKLKENHKKTLETDHSKRLIKNKIIEGIKDITVSRLLENEINTQIKLSVDDNILQRVKFLLYYFLEQQKLVDFVKTVGDFYNAYSQIIQTEYEADMFKQAVENGYTGVIKFIKERIDSEAAKKELEFAIYKKDDDNGEFTFLRDTDIDLDKKRTEKTKSFRHHLSRINSTVDGLSTAINRATTIALLEDKASKALKINNGGIYSEERISSNASPIGNDAMLYAKTSSRDSTKIANTLAIYYSFVPNNIYLYIAFSRTYGNKKYKSYIYHGVQYDFYVQILNEVIKSGTLGAAAWTIRHMNFRGRTLVQNTITGRTKFYQSISGEDKTKSGHTSSKNAVGVISSFEQYRKNRGRSGSISSIKMEHNMFSNDKLSTDAMLVGAFYNEAISLFTGSGKN